MNRGIFKVLWVGVVGGIALSSNPSPTDSLPILLATATLAALGVLSIDLGYLVDLTEETLSIMSEDEDYDETVYHEDYDLPIDD